MIFFRDLYLDGVALKGGEDANMCAIDNITYVKQGKLAMELLLAKHS